jgi:CheY-like chemotaxis protein
MRILVVEDDDTKRSELVTFLSETYDVIVESARSFQGGLRALLAEPPDLILLDMTMRNFDRSLTDDGGRPHPFAGREILRQMHRNRIDTPVLVVTQFDRFGEEHDFTTLAQLKEELGQKYPNYIGAIQFKGNVDDWKPAIKSILGSRVPVRGAS